MAKNWKYILLLMVALFIDVDVQQFYYMGHQLLVYCVLILLVYYQYRLNNPSIKEYKKTTKYRVVSDLVEGADVSFFINESFLKKLKYSSQQLGVSLDEASTSAMLLGIIFMYKHAHGSEFYEYVDGVFLPVSINRELTEIVSQPTDNSTSVLKIEDAEIFTLDDYRRKAK